MVDSGKLSPSFYLRDDVTEVARDLIGRQLCTQIDGKFTSGIIVETEAYSHLEKACHAHMNRRTRRTETLFAPGGTAYVYLCYGIHHLFNIVTNQEGVAEAVLIRALQPLEGIGYMQERRGLSQHHKLCSGPGKLSQALGITTLLNETDLSGELIWVSDLPPVSLEITADVRIGIDYAGEDALLPWRFLARHNRHISVPPKTG